MTDDCEQDQLNARKHGLNALTDDVNVNLVLTHDECLEKKAVKRSASIVDTSQTRSGGKSAVRTNAGAARRKNNTVVIERIEGSAYLFVRRGWWMKGKMKVLQKFLATSFDL